MCASSAPMVAHAVQNAHVGSTGATKMAMPICATSTTVATMARLGSAASCFATNSLSIDRMAMRRFRCALPASSWVEAILRAG